MSSLGRKHVRHLVGNRPHALADLRSTGKPAGQADIDCAAVADDHVHWVCRHDLIVTAESGMDNRMQSTGATYRATRKLVVSLLGVHRVELRMF